MFGKTKESTDTDTSVDTDVAIGEFFGDEAAVAEEVRMNDLFQRVSGVEQQINSQFTSMAAYAQIAQEQIEMVRSEAQHANERSEQRVIGLIERERDDRLGVDGATPDVTSRLDSLERQVGEIRDSLQQCLSNQKALADAITDLFTQPTTIPAPRSASATLPDEAPAPMLGSNDLLGSDDFMTDLHEHAAPAGARSHLEIDADDDFEFVFDPKDIELIAELESDGEAPDVDAITEDLAAPAPAFDVFAAPDISTIDLAVPLPAPVLNVPAPVLDGPASESDDGPIAALSLD